MQEKLGFGEVVEGTMAVIQRNWPPILTYLALFTVVGTAVEWGSLKFADTLSGLLEGFGIIQAMLGIGAGLAGLVIFVMAIIAQYFLWEALLRREGLGREFARHRYLAFFGQLILLAIATAFGYLLLIVPGLVFTVRWSLAPALLIGENQGVVQAMGNSWETIRGNTTPIAFTYLVGAVGVILISGGAGYSSAWDGTGETAFNLFSITVGQLASHVGTALAIALGVFLFQRFYGSQAHVSEVFA